MNDALWFMIAGAVVGILGHNIYTLNKRITQLQNNLLDHYELHKRYTDMLLGQPDE